jgi:acetyl esterase/lipase
VLAAAFVMAPGGGLGRAAEATFTPAERLQTERLKAAHEAVQQFARQRVALPDLGAREDFRAVIHVHAEDSNHTKGTREQVLAAAKQTGVRVVLFTDHRGPKPDTWRGLKDGVLFIPGSEDGDGKLRFPGMDADGQPAPAEELRFICHVEERYELDPKGFVGMEIVNRHTDAVLDKSAQEYLAQAARDPATWQKVVSDFKAYPDAMFAAGCDYRTGILAKLDREIQQRPLTAIGANDAHRNVVINDVTFDPYEVSFRNLSTHLLATNLTEPAVRAALREGHAYVSHDWLCDPTGFTFGAVNNLGVFVMGDAAPMQGSTRVMAFTPLPARLKLFYAGKVVAQTNGTNLTFKAKEPGAYRLEAWLDVAGEWRPWIYSNPVYLKEQSLLDMPLPNLAEAGNVDVRKDISYADGQPEDAAKHKLDLYIPKASKPAPVFVFIHGGAWRYGDRSLYPPFGQRFAKEGILTVIPSYRLVPKSPWPAQAEDAASAFAWTMQHIAEFGGDTNRVFLGGHSAGGHLASLLMFHGPYLEAHKLSSALIRGVVALSGVYNLDVGDIQSNVFGRDRTVRRDASPLWQIHAPAAPFLVTFCEWDYPTLPAQAKLFHAALRRAGVASELFYTPKENHISEVLAMTRDNDATAQAVVRFILGPSPEPVEGPTR